MALPDDLKRKLSDVLRYLAKHRREVAREERNFEAITDQTIDAEFSEVPSGDPFDLRELAEIL
jgi:hypothetical protein